MRLQLLIACAVCITMPALAFAAPYATVPAGTISVNNTAGQTLGALDDQAWSAIDYSETTIDLTTIANIKIKGGITNMTGQLASSWAGSWGTVGLYERSWIEGDYVGLAGFSSSPNSYKMGWTPNAGMVLYTDPGTSYADSGVRFASEDYNADSAHKANSGSYVLPPAIEFEIFMDMSVYDPADPAAGYGKQYVDYRNDPTNPSSQWYSEQNGGDLFTATGINVGRRHGTWDPSDPMYYDDYTDCVLGISLVEDNTGESASYTYTDITLEVAGRLPGDINFDGIVDEKDATIVAANWGAQGGVTWFEGDCGGGTDAWPLDGNVDDADLAVIADHWLMTMADLNSTSAVPEPSTFVLLALGCLMLFTRRTLRK